MISRGFFLEVRIHEKLPSDFFQVINEAAIGNSNEMPLLLDGQLLAKRFYNRTFKLRTGTYTFDQYGSLNAPNFVLMQFNGTNVIVLKNELKFLRR